MSVSGNALAPEASKLGMTRAGQAVLNYKRLAEVERAFRTLKGVDLQVRSIRHRLEACVKAHIFLGMLAYYVQWHMMKRGPPLTFKDDADTEPSRLADPVAPARRSRAALAKVHTRTPADGTPAMSFTRLLAHLATVVRNTMRPRSARPGEATFTLTTPPRPSSSRASTSSPPSPCSQSPAPRFSLNPLKCKKNCHRLTRNFGLAQQRMRQ